MSNNNAPESVLVAYKKLKNGHYFWAHRVKDNEPLMASACDIHDAVEQVSECLTHILGGAWKPSKDAVELIDEIASAKAGSPVSKLLESKGVASLNTRWVAEAA